MLNFNSAQGSVVNSYLIYVPRKILTVDTVSADLQRIRRDRDLSSLRAVAHLHAVYI